MPKAKGGKKKSVREVVTLSCQNLKAEGSKCDQRNYVLSKNKRNTPARLELKKFCKYCKKTTLHKEVK